MKIDFKKIIVRTSVGLVLSMILAYIFWPKSEPVEITTDASTTIVQPIVADAPCLVFYQKDKDIPVFKEGMACVETYVTKYTRSYYAALNVVCRSSSDGKTVNRNDLSSKRAKALQFSLLEKGIAFEDIKVTSLGDTSPYPGIDPESADGKILNRSCEITGILK
jgi:hypothetical protein